MGALVSSIGCPFFRFMFGIQAIFVLFGAWRRERARASSTAVF